MAESARRLSSRVPKPVVLSDQLDPDPTMMLLSGDEDDHGQGFTWLDRRDNDPEFDDPLQAVVDAMSTDEEVEDGSETSADDIW